jgi:hypothetical protein
MGDGGRDLFDRHPDFHLFASGGKSGMNDGQLGCGETVMILHAGNTQ